MLSHGFWLCTKFVRCLLECCLAQTELNPMLPHYFNDFKQRVASTSNCFQYICLLVHTHTFADDRNTDTHTRTPAVYMGTHTNTCMHSVNTSQCNTIEQLHFMWKIFGKPKPFIMSVCACVLRTYIFHLVESLCSADVDLVLPQFQV